MLILKVIRKKKILLDPRLPDVPSKDIDYDESEVLDDSDCTNILHVLQAVNIHRQSVTLPSTSCKHPVMHF